ncbi:HK97-gp10 family putative phage morphogenesis protein [Kitasatospora sp. NPDC059463]|uniref:HK97-gp10 family putative phage morphogenesis protein n=1 Tax=unclassified Kitasatospora TaxID=2633591 RepID=UPI0036CCD073
MARGRRPAGGGARSGLTVQIHGLERLVEQLEAMPERVQAALRRVVKESAEDVQRETLLNVRKDTGFLQRALDIRYSSNSLKAEVGWFNRDSYYAAFHEFGTKSISAKPALGPAIEGERNRIRDRVIAEVNKELQQLGGGR